MTTHGYSLDRKKFPRMRYPPQSPPSQNGPSNTGGQYFDRRGEVAELKQGLRSAISERDTAKMKENIKRVIGYMTLGIDMSRLFSEMVMAAQLGDIVQRKMVYLYLTTYAKDSGDLAILTINTLQKDTRDVDPSVRGLALRSMCSMHIANIYEYLAPAISAGLSDGSGYVRKSAVMGVLKLYNLVADISSFEITLRQLLRTDPDSSVVSNVIIVLEEKRLLEPEIDQQLVYNLLSRFSTFTEWGKSVVIDSVLSRYVPVSEDELFDLMNCLDVYMRQTSVCVSLGIIRLFLLWTEGGELQVQVISRISDPILTLLSAAATSPEMQLVVVAQIEWLVTKFTTESVPQFSPHWRRFLLTEFDTPELCRSKLAVLTKLASSSYIVSELQTYLRLFPLVEGDTVRALVESEEKDIVFPILIAHRSPASLSGVCDLLSNVTDHPKLSEIVSRHIKDVRCHDSLAWLMGRFGERIDRAPYYLEDMIDRIIEDEEGVIPVATVSSVVTAVVQLFLARPLETRPVLEKTLRYAIEQANAAEVRDLGLMYYRILHTVGPDNMKNGLAVEIHGWGKGEKKTVIDVSEFNSVTQNRFSCSI
jgi:AP-4 complex subunit beta-1